MGIKGYALLAVAVVCLLASCSILRNCRKILNPKPPRPPHSAPFDVVSVLSGNCIEVVKHGSKRRKPSICFLQGIDPATGDFAEAARARLAELCGKTVEIEWKRTGILCAEPQKTLNGRPVPMAPDPFDNWMRGHIKVCPTCKPPYDVLCGVAMAKMQEYDGYAAEALQDAPPATGIVSASAPDGPGEKFLEWFEVHKQTCPLCSDDTRLTAETVCPEALSKMGSLVEARPPSSGTVTGSGGVCQLALIREGLARCQGEVPKEWQSAEKQAVKEKRGQWAGRK